MLHGNFQDSSPHDFRVALLRTPCDMQEDAVVRDSHSFSTSSDPTMEVLVSEKAVKLVS